MRTYQRGGVWYIDYSFNGRRVRKKVGTSKKMAELALKEAELQIAKGEFLGVIEPKKVFFENLCCDYLLFSKANKTRHSHRRDETSIKNLLRVFRGTHISMIKAQALEKYKESRLDEVRPATVNRELSCIKHMMTKAVHWGLLAKNPMRSVTQLKEPPGRVRYLTEDEISRLLYCCPQHIKPIVVTALNTGMRKGEILGLKWEDVDLVKRVIHVRDSKNHRARHIPINDILYAELLRLPHGSGNGENVFLGKSGEPIRSIQNAWEHALKNAGIVDFRFHDLRHTFASHLAMNGYNLRDIQELLGQKTILMTMRYSHLSNEVLRKAVDSLNLGQYSDHEVGTDLAQTTSKKV